MQAMRYALFLSLLLAPQGVRCQERSVQQRTAKGTLEGVLSADGKVRMFKGVPYAAPPVGTLRWKPPQPAASWSGVRKATEFTPRCMQARVYTDMIFRDPGTSEDCLYLNVWAPPQASGQRLPVMVWIYGGGFAAGATSEPRQDGSNLVKKGVLVVSMNYRLGIFGFFSHPGLAQESAHHASGNYGLMDQTAALQWVHDNIAAFGGDPDNVTIFGESAGSFSVSAQMASPLSKGLFRRAIGESGAFFGDTLRLKTLEETEKADVAYAKNSLRTDSLEELRAMPAEKILEVISQGQGVRFVPNIDGYFLPESVAAIFAAGKQAHVPLLAGWNADEQTYRSILQRDEPTPQNYQSHLQTLYGTRAAEFLKAYAGTTPDQVKRAAQDLASDRFIAFGTWKWLDAHLETGKAPEYRYHFEQNLPEPLNAAPHASEIEFVFDALPSRELPWRSEDRQLSELMSTYWTNFAKKGDPNGAGLPKWPVYTKDEYQTMHLRAESSASADDRRGRYELLDSIR